MGMQGLKTFTVTLTTAPQKLNAVTGRLIATSLVLQVKPGDTADFWLGDNKMTQANRQGFAGNQSQGLFLSYEGEKDSLNVGEMFIMGTNGEQVVLTVLATEE